MPAPERIYLQGAAEAPDCEDPDSGVTWCWHQIDDSDVEYVRADLPRGTSAQILTEREITSSAIEGAICQGYQGRNPPPTPEHWLAQWWEMGRSQKQLEDELAEVKRDFEIKTIVISAWQRENSPGGWIDDLRVKLDRLEPTMQALRTVVQNTRALGLITEDQPLLLARALAALEDTKGGGT